MIQIKFNKLTQNIRQIMKFEKNKIKTSSTNCFNKPSFVNEYNLTGAEKENKILFEKIIKYETDLCTLCEIIQDNVLKR